MRVIQSKLDLIKIEGYVSYMPIDKYVQEAQLNNGRYYVNRGASGGVSISAKRCTKIASCINYLKH